VVNGTVDYKFNYLTGFNASQYNISQCPYKTLPNGNICAVETNITPLKINFVQPNDFKYSIDPIEYCPRELVATLACNYYNTDKTLVKDYTSCTKEIQINQADMMVSKTADKVYYVAPDTIIYTLAYQNISNVPIKKATIQDTLSEYLIYS